MERKGRIKKQSAVQKQVCWTRQKRKQLWIQANKEELKNPQALTYRTVTQQIDQNAKSLWNMAFIYCKNQKIMVCTN